MNLFFLSSYNKVKQNPLAGELPIPFWHLLIELKTLNPPNLKDKTQNGLCSIAFYPMNLEK